MNQNLESAIRKSHHLQKKQWFGYLRPQEILELRDLGVSYPCQENIVNMAIERKRKGVCNPLYFYFYPNEKFFNLKGVPHHERPEKIDRE